RLAIEELALPTEDPALLRQRLDDAYEAYAPTTPSECALVEQVVLAQLDIERCHRARATIRAEKARNADLTFDHAIEDEVERCKAIFHKDTDDAMKALRRTAGGVRYLLDRWAYLERRLKTDGSWAGRDRSEALWLQGMMHRIDLLQHSEDSYWIWVDCLAALENPRTQDIDQIYRLDAMPSSVRERGIEVWQPDPPASRARLHAMLEKVVSDLRQREKRLRT